jgi:two-component system cell cycle response regulator
MSADARKDLLVLRRITESLARDQWLETTLREIVDGALELVPADHASLRLLDESRSRLLAAARTGAGSEGVSLPLFVGEGIAGWVIENAAPALVADVQADTRFRHAAGQGFSIGSMIAEPLLAGGVAIGVLSVSSSSTNAFSPADALLIRILANCSVPLLERARLARLAVTDALTTAFNANYLAPRLAEEMERAKHSGTPLSLLAMDLDRLDRINQAFGRDLGDRVMLLFVQRVRGLLRRYDVLVRCGGDEFLVLLPGTSPTQAQATADGIRSSTEEPMEPSPGGLLTQTVSIGVATWNGSESADELLARASRGLWEAKQGGGNRVARAVARPPEGEAP